ncbi:hypothetical protein A9Q84_11295 [Halobacteriovorax marinus]|mgnify:CR=1 FL=1|uniref:Serine protease n=1 Tax=Halobacteriovorax marinus TaxID=97084 RepID=A0A1Y5F7Q0_9BACT|nr:hypothetical protein A9Q84_11295 [Halobacteriovorax marinus]
MKVSMFILSIQLLFSFQTLAVINGKDNRTLVENYPNQKIRRLAKSVAARVDNETIETLRSEDGKNIELYLYSHQEYNEVCEEEKFSKENILSDCTGFLIAPDILMTAGHCIESEADCKDFSWVFNFESKTEVIKDKEIYKCVKIYKHKLRNATNTRTQDYAIIKLHKRVQGVEPLKFSNKKDLSNGTRVLTIGHPSGLPKIVTDNGIATLNRAYTFTTTLDTYGGNSGSPVFNAKTLLVEGILVQGANDYNLIESRSCSKSDRSTGFTEVVHSIHNIKELRNIIKK